MFFALFAEEPIYGSPIRFSLLEGLDYDLNLTLGANVGRLYANVKYSVNKQDLPQTDYYSFFLNKEALLEHLHINGMNTQYFLCSNLHPKHFVPELKRDDLILADSDVSCYAIAAESLENLPDTLEIYLEYRLPLPDYSVLEDGRKAIMLGDIPFFYPRNLNASSEVNIHALSSIYHSMDRIIKEEDSGGLRRIDTFFVDIPDIKINLNIYMLN
jgi:hypothetical protein